MILVLLLTALPARAVEPVPPDKALTMHVARTITAPPDAPLEMPTDVALDANNRIYVVDGVNHRVVRFSPDGSFDGVLIGDSETQLERPIGATCDAQNRVWVADSGNHRVVVFDAAGGVEQIIDLPALRDGHEADPTDIVVTPGGERAYVVDNDNHRLAVRDNASGVWSTMGKAGPAIGQFQYPFMIAADREGNRFVTNVIGASVQIIDPEDGWSGQIGSWGVQLGRLYRPKGVAVDANNRIFVSDSSLGVVQAFDQRGRLVGVLADADGRPHVFEHPMGMCFDSNGRLYVVELRANRVAVVSFTVPEADEPATDRLP